MNERVKLLRKKLGLTLEKFGGEDVYKRQVNGRIIFFSHPQKTVRSFAAIFSDFLNLIIFHFPHKFKHTGTSDNIFSLAAL